MPLHSPTIGTYMNKTMSDNLINEISSSSRMKIMTVSDIEELGTRIRVFLTSHDVKVIETSGMGEVSIKLQEILVSCGVKKLTSVELEQLRLEVR